jgi:PPK2 family polyphosphate:nucleotide phosphotransferase
MARLTLKTDAFRIEPSSRVRLDKWSTHDGGGMDKQKGLARFNAIKERFSTLQEALYAEGQHALLVILQGMDAAGKDSTIRGVFGALNPQGVRVANFKVPTPIERSHDFLWRIHFEAPERGKIAVFNRSHYEDVLIVRVRKLVPKEVWSRRFEHINAFEKLLHDEGTRVLKFFLHISKDYQKEQLQSRLDDPQKRWKFNPDDLTERTRWDDYQQAFETALGRCSTAHAPWHIIPAERHWYRNLLIASACVDVLEELNPKPPHVDLDPRQYKIE